MLDYLSERRKRTCKHRTPDQVTCAKDFAKEGQISDSPAVALARSHLEAWTNHDFEKARRNLAEDVQFFSPAANLVGIGEYMDAPRGLVQFARQVVPGSLRVIASMGDERNALIMYEVSTEGGPIGSKVFPSAQTWQLDENGKIKVERIVSYMAPRRDGVSSRQST
jgi:SnoaL-like domain